MKNASFPLLPRGLLAAGLVASAACWAQLPSDMRAGQDQALARSEAPLAQGGGEVTYKVRSATLVCDGTTPFKGAQKIRLQYRTYHPINPNVVLTLVTNPGNLPVAGGSWPLPAGNVAQPMFTSPAVNLLPGQSITVQTRQANVQVPGPLHNRVVVAPDCGPKLQPGGFDLKSEIADPKPK